MGLRGDRAGSGLGPGSIAGGTRDICVKPEQLEGPVLLGLRTTGGQLTFGLVVLLDLPTEEVQQPWDHFAKQREITDVVDVELQRLRRQLSQLGLVCVLYSCQTEAQILAGTVGAEPEQSSGPFPHLWQRSAPRQLSAGRLPRQRHPEISHQSAGPQTLARLSWPPPQAGGSPPGRAEEPGLQEEQISVKKKKKGLEHQPEADQQV